MSVDILAPGGASEGIPAPFGAPSSRQMRMTMLAALVVLALAPCAEAWAGSMRGSWRRNAARGKMGMDRE